MLKISPKNIWRSIYEVIDDSFFEETDIFYNVFKTHVKIVQVNLSFHHLRSKKVLKKMALGKGLYAQVVMVFQKSYDNKK